MIRTAIVGLGTIAPNHLAAIAAQPGVALVAGCDTDPARRALLPDGTPFYTELGSLLQREKPDCVHLCLPHWLHYPAVLQAARAGVHVFAEKPPAATLEEAERLAGLEEEYGVKICISFQNRMNSTVQTLLPLLQTDADGGLRHIRGTVIWQRGADYYRQAPWRGIMAQAGGGAMINQAIHTLDLMQLFAGGPPAKIKGLAGQVLDYGIEVEDTAVASMEFAGGATGLFITTMANVSNDPVEIDFYCRDASYHIQGERLLRRGADGERQLAENCPPVVGKSYYGDGHTLLATRFYKAVEHGGSDYIHPADALPAMQMIDAIVRSSQGGKPVLLGGRAPG